MKLLFGFFQSLGEELLIMEQEQIMVQEELRFY